MRRSPADTERPRDATRATRTEALAATVGVAAFAVAFGLLAAGEWQTVSGPPVMHLGSGLVALGGVGVLTWANARRRSRTAARTHAASPYVDPRAAAVVPLAVFLGRTLDHGPGQRVSAVGLILAAIAVAWIARADTAVTPTVAVPATAGSAPGAAGEAPTRAAIRRGDARAMRHPLVAAALVWAVLPASVAPRVSRPALLVDDLLVAGLFVALAARCTLGAASAGRGRSTAR